MSDQPHYPYADGDIVVLGPQVFASADGETISWQGANYQRDRGTETGEASAAPTLFVLWLDASDGSVPTHDGVRWPDGTATVHHRHYGYTTTHTDPEAARQAAHGKQGRIVWPAPAPAHSCSNCEGVDPDTCAMNPDRPPEQCPNSEFDGYGEQCQKPAGHNLCSFEERPPAPAHDAGPSVAEAKADDRRWWGGEKTGEQ